MTPESDELNTEETGIKIQYQTGFGSHITLAEPCDVSGFTIQQRVNLLMDFWTKLRDDGGFVCQFSGHLCIIPLRWVIRVWVAG